ncbi:class II aldolase/adducin family protein [Pseudomonas schmalbachii]|nr:class II aldolase/adducin family protein [Pseudomonas schmalbachii]
MTEDLSALEWQARVDLAACYRLIELFGWSDLIANHVSMRVPGFEDQFLINPFGLAFDEITASSLLKIDLDGNQLSESSYQANKAGFTIHSAVHQVRHDANCVLHLHSLDGMAVSALEEGLLPLFQSSMFLTGDVAYHDFEGPALNLEERERLQRDLGERHVMILRNHGTLTVGATVAEAFVRMHMLERACAAQIRALSTGRPLCRPSEEARLHTEKMGLNSMFRYYAPQAWPALLRKLNREMPGYDS